MKTIAQRLCTFMMALIILGTLPGCTKGPAANPDIIFTTVPATQSLENMTQPEEWEGLEILRQKLQNADAIGGIFCLGYYDGKLLDSNFHSFMESYMSDFPFLSAISRGAINDGGEIYCIIPTDPKAKVSVTKWDESVAPTVGETLYDSKHGEPFFVQGNVSDIMPNLSVNISDSKGKTLAQYHPCISLMDGSICTPDGETEPVIMDLTPAA